MYHILWADTLHIRILFVVISFETPFLHFQEVVDKWFCRILRYGHCCSLSLPFVAIVLYFLPVPCQLKKYIQSRRVKQLKMQASTYWSSCMMFYWKCKNVLHYLLSLLSFLLYRYWLLIQTSSWNPWLLLPMFHIHWALVALTTSNVPNPYTDLSRTSTHSSGFSFI